MIDGVIVPIYEEESKPHVGVIPETKEPRVEERTGEEETTPTLKKARLPDERSNKEERIPHIRVMPRVKEELEEIVIMPHVEGEHKEVIMPHIEEEFHGEVEKGDSEADQRESSDNAVNVPSVTCCTSSDLVPAARTEAVW